MALIQAYNPSQSGSGQEILTAKQFVTFNAPFSSGDTITLSTVGTGLISASIIFNYMDKILTQSPAVMPAGVLPDYSVTGADELTLLFGDDPTQYEDGVLWGQITYQYYA